MDILVCPGCGGGLAVEEGIRCLECGEEVEDRTAPFPELPPMCGCGGMLRPAVVWFGESLPGEIFESAFQEAAASSIFLVAGSSAVVEPAAGKR